MSDSLDSLRGKLYLSDEEVAKERLSSFFIGNGDRKKDYLIELAYPRGVETLVRAYRVLEKLEGGYSLREVDNHGEFSRIERECTMNVRTFNYSPSKKPVRKHMKPFKGKSPGKVDN